MMVGVTLAIGGLVASSALGQFVLANDSASVGATGQESLAGVQIGMVYLVVTPSTSCPVYGGYHEGTTIEVAIYNYGEVPFTPAEMILNGTVYAGNYAPMGPGSLRTYVLASTTCSHPAGQTVLVADPAGDEVQFES